MNEHLEHGQGHDDASDAPREPGMTGDLSAQQEPVETTGHPIVDEVVASMRDLTQRPVEEHVAIFESAHEKLRAALANAGDRPDGPTGS